MSRESEIQELIYQFISLRRKLAKDILDDSINVTSAQREVLFCIYHDKEVSASEISTKLGITAGATTQLLDGLSEQHLISKAESSDDKRIMKIRISHHGRTLINKTKNRKIAKLNTVLKTLDIQEITVLTNILSKINNSYKAKKE